MQAYESMRIFKSQIIALITALVFVACSDDSTGSTKPDANKVHFVSAEQTATISLPVLKSFAQMSGETEFMKLLKYSVTKYTISYRTTFKGELIQASGILLVPDGMDEEAPLISLQHGTEFLKADAPSTSSGPSGMEYFASAGYIAFMPDFIGYGQSEEIFHPYYDEESSALCVIDMIKAVKEYLSSNQIPFNDKLFLAGYSEGGYVTLAAAKEIDTNAEHALKVTAVAAGAGGYDLSAMLQTITDESYYAYPSYLAFVLTAYDKTYELE
jgi:dipeptidyl aminopeptidase/acylaminoacyl peptidase